MKKALFLSILAVSLALPSGFVFALNSCEKVNVTEQERLIKGLSPVKDPVACASKILENRSFCKGQMNLSLRFYKAFRETNATPSCRDFYKAGYKLSSDLLSYVPALNDEVSENVSPLLRARLEIQSVYLRQLYLLVLNSREAGLATGLNKSTCLEDSSVFTKNFSRDALVSDLRNQLYTVTAVIRAKWGMRGLENINTLAPELERIASAEENEKNSFFKFIDYIKSKFSSNFIFSLVAVETLPTLSAENVSTLYQNIVEFSSVDFDSPEVYQGIVAELETQEKNLLEKCSVNKNCLSF